MLMTQWPNPNSTMCMVAVILYLMDWTEPLMWCLPERRPWSSVTEMSEKVVPPPWEPKTLLSMWLNATLSVLYKPVWKVSEWSLRNKWSLRSTSLWLLLVTRISSWPPIWWRWRTMLLSAILDILTTKSTCWAWARCQVCRNKWSKIWWLDGNSRTETEFWSWLKDVWWIWDVLLVTPVSWWVTVSPTKLSLKSNYGKTKDNTKLKFIDWTEN